MKKSKRYRKLKRKEWAKAILYALAILLCIRLLWLDKIHVVNSSMSPAIENGDYVLINKWSIGTRLPSSIPFTDIYFDPIRLPFGDSIQRFDMIAFNKGQDTSKHIDRKFIYIKRIIGLPSDTLKMENGSIFINDSLLNEPFQTKSPYLVYPSKRQEEIKDLFELFNIYEYYGPYPNKSYKCNLCPKQLKVLDSSEYIINVEKIDWSEGIQPLTDMHCDECKWDLDNFGPVIIPKKGKSITLDQQNFHFLYNTLEIHENVQYELRNDSILLNDSLITTHTFKQDYYFVLGDNRHNSIDSRFFGLIPRNHLLGKVNTTLFNYNSGHSRDGRILKKTD